MKSKEQKQVFTEDVHRRIKKICCNFTFLQCTSLQVCPQTPGFVTPMHNQNMGIIKKLQSRLFEVVETLKRIWVKRGEKWSYLKNAYTYDTGTQSYVGSFNYGHQQTGCEDTLASETLVIWWWAKRNILSYQSVTYRQNKLCYPSTNCQRCHCSSNRSRT